MIFRLFSMFQFFLNIFFHYSSFHYSFSQFTINILGIIFCATSFFSKTKKFITFHFCIWKLIQKIFQEEKHFLKSRSYYLISQWKLSCLVLCTFEKKKKIQKLITSEIYFDCSFYFFFSSTNFLFQSFTFLFSPWKSITQFREWNFYWCRWFQLCRLSLAIVEHLDTFYTSIFFVFFVSYETIASINYTSSNKENITPSTLWRYLVQFWLSFYKVLFFVILFIIVFVFSLLLLLIIINDVIKLMVKLLFFEWKFELTA